MTEIVYKELSYRIIGIAMEVHKILGGGFLEKVYENSMMLLFEENNLNAKNQVKIDVFFKNKVVGDYVADILVDDKIILELKTVEKISDIHRAQLFNYLKATNKKLGIIINFKNQKLEYERIVL